MKALCAVNTEPCASWCLVVCYHYSVNNTNNNYNDMYIYLTVF